MRLVFDTETTGLRKKGLPTGDPSQPRIAQLAASVYDARWNRVQHFSTYIKPDGWAMEPGAERVNGISEAMCHKYGIPIVVALVMLREMVATTMQIIGHAVQFDREMVEHELHVARADPLWWQKKAHAFACTQEICTPICQLPGQFGDFKFPSLEEARTILLPAVPFTVTHEAGHDVHETAILAQEIDRRGLLPKPRSRHVALHDDSAWRKGWD